VCYGRPFVGRGNRGRRPSYVAVLGGLAAAGALIAGVTAGSAVTTPVASTGTEAVAPVENYRLRVDAVAYHLPGVTASGLPVGKGVVAVDPKLIPLGTRLFIPGYGRGIAADVGVAIKGRLIDVWMPSRAAARRWGRKTVTITVYG
jgi:3D (Asp-Asp-Asp) domain-containing protein